MLYILHRYYVNCKCIEYFFSLTEPNGNIFPENFFFFTFTNSLYLGLYIHVLIDFLIMFLIWYNLPKNVLYTYIIHPLMVSYRLRDYISAKIKCCLVDDSMEK